MIAAWSLSLWQRDQAERARQSAQLGQLAGRFIVGIVVAPGLSGVDEVLLHAGNGNRYVEVEDVQVLLLDIQQLAVLSGGDDGARDGDGKA